MRRSDHHFDRRDRAPVAARGRGGPGDPGDAVRVGDDYSISLALEYSGHWVKVVRAQRPAGTKSPHLIKNFQAALPTGASAIGKIFGRARSRTNPGFGAIFALQVEHQGLYYGDTCIGTETL